ncbi:hypothetical protein QOT17_019723 [Balamuthia mandrillaris]
MVPRYAKRRRGKAPTKKATAVMDSDDFNKENDQPSSVNISSSRPKASLAAASSLPKANATKAKKTRKVGFVSDQPTEIITFTRNEPPKLQLDGIHSRDYADGDRNNYVSHFVPRYSEEVEEVILDWSSDDQQVGNFWSIHDLGQEFSQTMTLDTEKLSIAELKEELKQRGLSTSGKKAILLARLEEALIEEGAVVQSVEE